VTKRSGHIGLLVMGTAAVGMVAYSAMRPQICNSVDSNGAPIDPAVQCSHGSSGNGGHMWHSWGFGGGGHSFGIASRGGFGSSARGGGGSGRG
jgi:hypothetical protein